MAVTLKVALLPVHVVTFWGCVVIAGAEFTTSEAVFEFRPVGLQLNTVTRYTLPLAVAATEVNVNVEVVAPAIFVKVTPPSVLTCH